MATPSITPRRNVHGAQPGQPVTANPAALQRARALRLSTTDSSELEVPPKMSFQPPGHKSPPLSPHGEPYQQEFSTCVQANTSNIASCQMYADQLESCRATM